MKLSEIVIMIKFILKSLVGNKNFSLKKLHNNCIKEVWQESHVGVNLLIVELS